MVLKWIFTQDTLPSLKSYDQLPDCGLINLLAQNTGLLFTIIPNGSNDHQQIRNSPIQIEKIFDF